MKENRLATDDEICGRCANSGSKKCRDCGPRAYIVVMASENMIKAGFHCGEFARKICEHVGWYGGGSARLGQGGGKL